MTKQELDELKLPWVMEGCDVLNSERNWVAECDSPAIAEFIVQSVVRYWEKLYQEAMHRT